jgi:hypothetical protein
VLVESVLVVVNTIEVVDVQFTVSVLVAMAAPVLTLADACDEFEPMVDVQSDQPPSRFKSAGVTPYLKW